MVFDFEISSAIFESYSTNFSKSLNSDVIIVGAGPSGLLSAGLLSQNGLKVTLIEKRLALGGGIWGGAIGMPEIVIEKSFEDILSYLGIKPKPYKDNFFMVSAFELSAALILFAVKSGAIIHNLTYMEDLLVIDKKVCGVVINKTFMGDNLPIDPLTLQCRAVIDATGHDAQGAVLLAKRGLIKSKMGDGVMDALSGEDFVVEKAGLIFPGLYLTGMSICSYYGGPRMGPIFGGMLKSGEKISQLILKDLGKKG